MSKKQIKDSRPTLRAVQREAAAIRKRLQAPHARHVAGYLLGIDATLNWFRHGRDFIRPSVMAIHAEEMYEAGQRAARRRTKNQSRPTR